MIKKYNQKQNYKNQNDEVISVNSDKSEKTKTLNPIDIYVGGRLKEKRSSLGLSQDKLAKQLGLTFQQIQKYEKGLNRIGSSRLYELSKILKVKVSYFFENYELLSEKTINIVSIEDKVNKESLHRDIQKAIKLFESANSHTIRKNMIAALNAILNSVNKNEKE